MNLRTIFPMVAVSAFLLVGCGAKTVKYAEFHEKALAVEKHSFTKAEVSYSDANSTAKATLKFGADISVVTLNVWALDEGDSVVGTAAAVLANAPASAVAENENYTYQLDGKNFKVQYNKTDYDCFESHGLLTQRVVGEAKYVISYKK